MEINITELVKEENYTEQYYPVVGSVAQFGEKAAVITWENAKLCARDHQLLRDEGEIILAKEFFKGMGFSEDMTRWSTTEVNALMLQHVLLELAEYRYCPDNSSIFQSDDGDYYIHIGS